MSPKSPDSSPTSLVWPLGAAGAEKAMIKSKGMLVDKSSGNHELRSVVNGIRTLAYGETEQGLECV